MWRARAGTAVVALTLVTSAGWAQPDSATERKRQQILKQLGIKKKPGPAPGSGRAPVAPEIPAAPEAPAAPGSQAETEGAGKAAEPVVVVFTGAVHAGLRTGCGSCHGAGGTASHTRFVLGNSPQADFERTRAFVDTARPPQSPLVTKGAGEAHGGGRIHPPGTRPYRQLIAWIAAGARFTAGGEAVPPPPPLKTRPVSPALPPLAAPQPPLASPLSPPSPSPPNVSPPIASLLPIPATGTVPGPPSAVPDTLQAVHRTLTGGCVACHNPNGSAGGSRLQFSGAVGGDLLAARSFVDLSRPTASPLLVKGSGAMHGGGIIYPPETAAYQTLLAWIVAGAPGATTTDVPASSSPIPAAPATPEPPSSIAVPSAPASSSLGAGTPVAAAGRSPAAHGAAGLGLPLGLHLNGRFDLAYERRNLGRDTGFLGGQNALRSYHQFLFLSRSAGEMPIGFTVELVSLQIWEATFRHRFAAAPLHLLVRGGKMLVPFGAEPFHELYGGLAGFDQKALPPLWAQEGIGEQLTFQVADVAVASDLYLVRGYRVRTADAVLNLQNDFSPLEDAKVAVGHRLGLAWGPATFWYSTYFNALGAGRRLFLQAMDLGFGRLRDVPLLGRFTFALGFMRADVSGAGQGRDYYHLASYAQARFYPKEWLYLQYRQGLRTFNNRRGFIVDETRLDASDGSTHTAGLAVRWRGLSGGVHYYWNFEKADEQDDDFFRLMVAYDF